MLYKMLFGRKYSRQIRVMHKSTLTNARNHTNGKFQTLEVFVFLVATCNLVIFLENKRFYDNISAYYTIGTRLG